MTDQYDNFYMYDPEYLFSLYSSQSANQVFNSNQTQLETSSLTNETDSSSKYYVSERIINYQSTKNKIEPEKRIRWTKDEHRLFELALVKHGKSKHKLIQHVVQSKSVYQCISHSQKFFVKLDNLFERGMKEPVSEKIQKEIENKFPRAFTQLITMSKIQIASGINNMLKAKTDETVVDSYVKYLESKRI
ncbi:Myb-like_DNA-binding domain-containing protein [Hexamita inflata]|uniref:Myb-like DNA-binding domain-containing protein n=1 Tax=Hexamita inflata TaxID=28002 RepID=A0AA86RGD9_9EUKA|nr:Myb-like DNA-binding domain-containing protein [Hexamita inflata]